MPRDTPKRRGEMAEVLEAVSRKIPCGYIPATYWQTPGGASHKLVVETKPRTSVPTIYDLEAGSIVKPDVNSADLEHWQSQTRAKGGPPACCNI